MSRKIKRQLQISKLPRKKGCYISKDQAETELKAVEKRTENEIINDWAEENLKEFQKVEKKLITEILCWHENAMRNEDA
ncbi:19130_t:CDS:2 [Rhizophagus irregularis]|nr:19130_t:CDS:2 [Rhizophagus irregularis]